MCRSSRRHRPATSVILMRRIGVSPLTGSSTGFSHRIEKCSHHPLARRRLAGRPPTTADDDWPPKGEGEEAQHIAGRAQIPLARPRPQVTSYGTLYRIFPRRHLGPDSTPNKPINEQQGLTGQ
jgi:hypothetical protein